MGFFLGGGNARIVCCQFPRLKTVGSCWCYRLLVPGPRSSMQEEPRAPMDWWTMNDPKTAHDPYIQHFDADIFIQVNENVRYGAESNADDKRETAHSTITISLANHEEENGAVYKCQARNSAVFGPPMSAFITLSILCKYRGNCRTCPSVIMLVLCFWWVIDAFWTNLAQPSTRDRWFDSDWKAFRWPRYKIEYLAVCKAGEGKMAKRYPDHMVRIYLTSLQWFPAFFAPCTIFSICQSVVSSPFHDCLTWKVHFKQGHSYSDSLICQSGGKTLKY